MEYPELFVPYRQKIANALKKLKNEGVVRNVLKIYAEIPLNYIKIEKSGLVNLCFDYLISQNTPVSIKAYSMDILFKITMEIPDIGTELYSVIENQLPVSSAGYRSRAQKILRKLANISPY